MKDEETTIQKLKEMVTHFRDERDWGKFNDPKSVAQALSIEASELLEVFLWKEKDQITESLKNEPDFRDELSDEIADVFIYLLQIANDSGIELSKALEAKMEKNALKYPVEKSRGKATKYTKL
ncbi:MAG TPA: nucleotide pyrophosphohydrolase [Candidatus Paceibacterota bacterium]